MKVWAGLAVVPILGSLAQAESLGDVAKREHDRREKKGEVVKAPVIREEELVSGPGRASKGTFNPAAGSARGPANANGKQPSSSSAGNGGTSASTEIDARRAVARERLDASYERIRETASLLSEAVSQYRQCGVPISARGKSCQGLLADIWDLARSVAASMEDAEDAAREGWLTPGDVRDARRRYGMGDAFWDELVRVVRQYRR